MKKALLASAALGTLLIGNPSLAADLAVRGPWVAAIPVFTWTGCYVGTHVGGGWADETITAPAIVPGVSVTQPAFSAAAKSVVIFNLPAIG
jgi:outer membrane immunogenic protein